MSSASSLLEGRHRALNRIPPVPPTCVEMPHTDGETQPQNKLITEVVSNRPHDRPHRPLEASLITNYSKTTFCVGNTPRRLIGTNTLMRPNTQSNSQIRPHAQNHHLVRAEGLQLPHVRGPFPLQHYSQNIAIKRTRQQRTCAPKRLPAATTPTKASN